MTRPSKRKSIVKEQRWDNNRKFAKRSRVNDNWGDENDSGWDEIYLPNEEKNKSKLVWSDNAHLKQKKREPYLTGTIKKYQLISINMDQVILLQEQQKELSIF